MYETEEVIAVKIYGDELLMNEIKTSFITVVSKLNVSSLSFSSIINRCALLQIFNSPYF